MKLTKGTLRRIIKEESRRLTEKEEYKQFFKRALEKAGKSIPQMSDSEKKEFFNKIDKTWKGKNESVVNEKKVPKKGSPDYHQHKIAVDTVRNPMKSFMGGPSWKEAEETLIKKFGYSKKEVDKLRESVNEARTVSKPIKVDNETMVQIVGDNKGFRELTATLNPKTGKPIQKFGYDRGNEIADSKEELVKKLQKKYGKSIKFESVNEAVKIKMNALDWGKSTAERNSNLDKYDSLKTDKEREAFLRKLKGESVNEAKSQDPTLKEMVKFLKSNYRDEEEFSILLAIYFYSEANYGGMRSNLYSALSQLSNKMRVRTKFSDERGTEIEMMVDDLVDEFGGERP